MTNNALEMNYKCTKQKTIQTLNSMMEKNHRMYNDGDLVECKVMEKLAKREEMEMSSNMQGDGDNLQNTRQLTQNVQQKAMEEKKLDRNT